MRIAAVLSLTLLLVACAGTPEILVSQPGATGPGQLRTYQYRSAEAVVAAGERARRSDARLAEIAARKLAEKGYSEAGPGATPDFILTYRVAVFTSENPRDAYAYVRDPTKLTGRELAPDPAGSEGLMRETTLVLMALSVPEEKVIWQATASGVAAGQQELTTGALNAAGAMLDRFPKRQP